MKKLLFVALGLLSFSGSVYAVQGTATTVHSGGLECRVESDIGISSYCSTTSAVGTACTCPGIIGRGTVGNGRTQVNPLRRE
jgi:hypothetical protein